MCKCMIEMSHLFSLGGAETHHIHFWSSASLYCPSLPGVSALFLFTACPLAGAAGFTGWAELELHFATMLNFSSKDSFTSAASCSRSSEQTQEKVCEMQRTHQQPVSPTVAAGSSKVDKETQTFKFFFCAVGTSFVRSQGFFFQNKICDSSLCCWLIAVSPGPILIISM